MCARVNPWFLTRGLLAPHTSGALLELSKIQKAVEMGWAAEYDILVVCEIDRLARGTPKQIIVEQELKQADVSIEYVLDVLSDAAQIYKSR